MKKLIYLTTLSLMAVTSVPTVYANSATDVIGAPHISSTTQFPLLEITSLKRKLQS